MAYVKCITAKNGFDIEVVRGEIPGTSSNITVSSQKGKAPKCLQFWRSDDITTNIFWLSWHSDFDYFITKYSATYQGTTVYYRTVRQVGTKDTQFPSVVSVGDTSVVLHCPMGYSSSSWTWKYYVEFE